MTYLETRQHAARTLLLNCTLAREACAFADLKLQGYNTLRVGFGIEMKRSMWEQLMNNKHKLSCLLLMTFVFSPTAWSQPTEEGTYELLGVSTQPAVVSAGQNFVLVFSGYNIDLPADATYTIEGDVIRVTGGEWSCFGTGQPPHPPNNRPTIVTVPISGLPAGTYQVAGDWAEDCHNHVTSIEAEITVFPNSQTMKFFHESPAAGDVVSGVNVIRGWACYPEGKGQIGEVTYTIDDFDEYHFPLPYGSVRQDTVEVCGLEDGDLAKTGYGGVVYWPTIANEGDHTLTIYIDGKEVDSLRFTVASPPPTSVPEDVGYRKGAAGEYIIDGFLGTQESVNIRWSEADQNFIIVDYN
jgi:hypothetical protein